MSIKNKKKLKSMPLIGDPAPEFNAITTKGKIEFPKDYAGSWREFDS